MYRPYLFSLPWALTFFLLSSTLLPSQLIIIVIILKTIPFSLNLPSVLLSLYFGYCTLLTVSTYPTTVSFIYLHSFWPVFFFFASQQDGLCRVVPKHFSLSIFGCLIFAVGLNIFDERFKLSLVECDKSLCLSLALLHLSLTGLSLGGN
jgi:hypothetical protein